MKSGFLFSCRFSAALLTLIPALTTRSPASAAPADFDLQGFVDKQLADGVKKIVIPAGRHRVFPKGNIHLKLKDIEGVEILADGAELACGKTGRVVVFENCRNVRLKGLTVDFDPLPFTQGKIVDLAPDKRWVEFEIIAGYPDNQLVERIEIFDSATKELRRETGGWAEEFESMGNGRYRAFKPDWYRYQDYWDTEQIGDILVTANRFPNNAGGHAFSAINCVNLTIEDVTLYAASAFGFVEKGCDGTKYLRCEIGRRPPEDDPVPRAFPRLRSLNADAFHSSMATRGPSMIGCSAKYQGDDCVNIHGIYHPVTACQGKQLRIAALRELTINPGDPVEFLPVSGVRPPDAKAVAVEPDEPITAAEKEFFAKRRMFPRHKEALLSGKARFFKLTLDRSVALEIGSGVCSGLRVGNGFLVKDCDFGHNRSRGILIKASRGQVIGNTISNGWMAAILVKPELSYWLESASSSDVIIRDNVINGCRKPAIEVVALGYDGKPLASGAHRNITVANNRIVNSAWPNIYVTSTEGLVLSGNTLTPSPPARFRPPLARTWKWEGKRPAAVVTEQCGE
jgi:hypothetical protein